VFEAEQMLPHYIENHNAIMEAAGRGDLSELNNYRPLANPIVTYCNGATVALHQGHTACVLYLLDQCELPSGFPTDFLLTAAMVNNIAVVQDLLRRGANPSHNHCAALRAASDNKCVEVFDLLYPLSNVVQALKRIDPTVPSLLRDRYEAERQAEKLRKLLNNTDPKSGSKSLRKL